MKTLTLTAGLALAVAVLGGCATPGVVMKVAPPEGVRPEIHFTSEVPDAYWVLSGPAGSYGKYAVNGDLRKAFEEYAARGAASDGKVAVSVHLLSVVTGYREIGDASPPARRNRLASAPLGSIVLAEDLDHDWSIPEEIHKSVDLLFESEILRPDGALRRRSFTAVAREVIYRDRWDRWAYSYDDVMQAAIRDAVVRLDGILREELAR